MSGFQKIIALDNHLTTVYSTGGTHYCHQQSLVVTIIFQKDDGDQCQKRYSTSRSNYCSMSRLNSFLPLSRTCAKLWVRASSMRTRVGLARRNIWLWD